MGLGCLMPVYRLAVLGLLASFSVAAISCDYAEAKTARHAKQGKQAKQGKSKSKRVVHGPNYHPPYAAIVVDANSDQVLHEASPDAPRHPASLTKVMTLYLLFEQIEAGKFKLDTRLQVSAHAASQTPTKLGLKANQTLAVEDAIKGLVTKSANDAAAVVGEAIGGTESDFAKLMTEKARALGMVNTTYINASGLPAVEQITTARDQAILGRAVQDRFPGFYRYFSLPSFRYGKVELRNHNGLLGQLRGVDGIKTGYTEASGYNLVLSVHRDNRHIVAVVLGGKSGAARNARMTELVERHITLGAVRRTAPKIMEATDRDKAQQISAETKAPDENVKPATISLPDPQAAPSGENVKPATIPLPAPQAAPSGENVKPAAIPLPAPQAAPSGENVKPTTILLPAPQAAPSGENVKPAAIPLPAPQAAPSGENVKPATIPLPAPQAAPSGENVKPATIPLPAPQAAPSGENVKPTTILLPAPQAAPSGSVEPTLASAKSEQAEAASSKSRKRKPSLDKPSLDKPSLDKPSLEEAKPQTEVARAAAIAKLPTVRSRAAASKPAAAKARPATSVSIVAPAPLSSW